MFLSLLGNLSILEGRRILFLEVDNGLGEIDFTLQNFVLIIQDVFDQRIIYLENERLTDQVFEEESLMNDKAWLQIGLLISNVVDNFQVSVDMFNAIF